MSLLILIWLALGIVLDRLLVVVPADIGGWKKALYYFVFSPYLALVYGAQFVTNKTIWGAVLNDWFKS